MALSPRRLPPTVRLVVALLLFTGALASGVYFGVGRPVAGDRGQRQVRVKKDEATGGFFYSTLGAAGTPAAEAPRATGTTKDSYTLEIKVASSRGEAEALIDRLHEQGVEAYYTPLTRGGHVVYRVRQGIFANQKDADRAAAAVRRSYALAPKVVKLQ